jgi:alpha-mannosidase
MTDNWTHSLDSIKRLGSILGTIIVGFFVQGTAAPGPFYKTVDVNYALSDTTDPAPQQQGLKSHPELMGSLKILASRTDHPLPLYLLNSTHQDIAWMDSPMKCELFRDTLVITPLLKKMEQDPSFHFDIEDVLMIREYIQRHPDRKGMIDRVLKNGQLNVGGSFNMVYEDMYGPEALVRQFYQGTRWMNKEFQYSPTTYWNVDVPARTLQMPQILAKAGIKMMVISRMEKGVFNWEAPDGSKVLSFSPGHYGDLYFAYPNQSKQYKGLDYIAKYTTGMDSNALMKSTGSIPVPLLWDMDMASPVAVPIVKTWNSLPGKLAEAGMSGLHLPAMEYTTSSTLYHALKDSKAEFPTIRGERPDMWLYIHGPSHEYALHASRDADILLPDAEKFSVINALLDKDFEEYPVDRLTNAWEAKIYPDHGWGGKHGNITDNFFLQKFYFARQEGHDILQDALQHIAGKIKFNASMGRPLVAFNSLAWKRDGPISKKIRFAEGKASDVKVVDASGRQIPTQVSQVEYYPDHSIQSLVVSFIATEVPSLGYKTYYLEPVKSTLTNQANGKTASVNDRFESDYYRIQLGEGGLKSIFDKQLNRELLNTGKFMGGEIFTMHSKGNGAGEFADIQKPDMEGFDKTSLHSTEWKVLEDGPVTTKLQFKTPLKYADAQVTVVLYKHIKRIDFDVDLLNWEGVLYREFRMAMPLQMQNAQVAYQVPFGILKVGQDELHRPAGERYKTDCREVHPRGIENWIGAGNGTERVTLSSDVAVADYIDPTDNPVDYTILQPILLASRRSCHGEGNEYLQTGAHHFSFSFFSGVDDMETSAREGQAANQHLYAVTDIVPQGRLILPESESFFSVDDPDIHITAVKKAADNDAVVLRMFNQTGSAAQTSVHSYFSFHTVQQVDIIEKNGKPIQSQKNTVKVPMGKYSIETIKADIE